MEVLQNADNAIVPGCSGILLICLMLFTGSVHTAENDFDAEKKAAEQGDVDAQASLGVMYAIGVGVP